MPQDPNPMYWGAMDRFQAHFIVRKEYADPGEYVAHTRPVTQGHFGNRKVVQIKWEGYSDLARVLSNDKILNDMILKQGLDGATIFVEPTDGHVRIHTKWRNQTKFGITKEEFEIYNRIAGHIKSYHDSA